MENRVLWASDQTKDLIGSLSDEDKKNILSNELGYDGELLDNADLDTAVANDNYIQQNDLEDFQRDIVPMINSQTNGNVIALNKDDPQADFLVADIVDLVNNNVCPEAARVQLVDTADGLELQYFNENNEQCLSLILFAIPEDPEEEKQFINKVMPSAVDADIFGDDFEDDDPFMRPSIDVTDVDTLEDFVDKDLLKQYGRRIISESAECLTEDAGPDGMQFPSNWTQEDIESVYNDDGTINWAWYMDILMRKDEEEDEESDTVLESLDEDTDLNEDLPKPLADAYRKTIETHSKYDEKPTRFGYANITRTPTIDFKNAEYEEITPEEALAKYKAGDSRNVYAVVNGSLCNRYKTPGDPNYYDFRVAGQFVKDNGKIVSSTARLTPAEMYNMASHIYVVKNEPAYNQALADTRRQTVYSKAERRNSRVRPERDFQIDRSKTVNLSSYSWGDKVYINTDNTLAQYEGYAEYFPNNLKKPSDIEAWKAAYEKFKAAPTTDLNTRQDKLIDQVYNHILKTLVPDTKVGDPRAYKWSDYNRYRDTLSRRNTYYLRDALDSSMRDGKAYLSKINTARESLSRITAERFEKVNPQQLENNKKRILSDLNKYYSYISDYMNTIADLQVQLDAADDEFMELDAKYAAEVSAAERGLEKVKEEFRKYMQQRFFDASKEAE